MISETISQIEARLLAKFKSTPPFNAITLSGSNVAMFSNYLNTIATEIYSLEQLNNTFETEIENIILGVTTPTNLWWQKQILNFQYSASNPQVVQLDTVNFNPYYPVVNPAYRIITNCSVITLPNNFIQIKVTNNGVPLDGSAGIAGLQAIALEAFIQTISPAGIQHTIINEFPDRLYLVAEIFYNGQYSASIQVNVINALDNFLKSIPFNAIVKVSAIEDAIQAVAGVTDVVISQAGARKKVTAAPGWSFFPRIYQTYSGQIIQEDTASYTFADTLTFTVANN